MSNSSEVKVRFTPETPAERCQRRLATADNKAKALQTELKGRAKAFDMLNTILDNHKMYNSIDPSILRTWVDTQSDFLQEMLSAVTSIRLALDDSLDEVE